MFACGCGYMYMCVERGSVVTFSEAVYKLRIRGMKRREEINHPSTTFSSSPSLHSLFSIVETVNAECASTGENEEVKQRKDKEKK